MDVNEISHSDAAAFENNVHDLHADSKTLDKLLIKCPKCHADMVKHKATPKAGPVLDICSSCKGVWFDQNEFKKNYKNWNGIGKQKNKKPLKLFCVECATTVETKYLSAPLLSEMPKCPRCARGLCFEFVHMRDHSPQIYLVASILLVGILMWVMNFWKEADRRQINLKQPVGINEVIYGGAVHARVKNSGKSFLLSMGGGKFSGRRGRAVETASMVDYQYFYYFKGIENDQLRIEYVYPDSNGEQVKMAIELPLRQQKAALQIPAPFKIKSLEEKTLILTAVNNNQAVLVEEQSQGKLLIV